MQDEQFGGPQFGGENNGVIAKATAWFKQNGSKIVLPVVAVIILAVGIFLYYRLQPGNNRAVNETPRQEETASKSSAPLVAQPQPGTSEKLVTEPQPGPATITPAPQPKKQEQKVEVSGKTITITAQKGNGVTHLARQALKSYGQENPEVKLNKEQKIYIEDYLRRHTAQKRLMAGDQISFDQQLIADAIGQAQALTPNQLQNLQKYSVRVTLL